MKTEQEKTEVLKMLESVVSKWSPDTGEPFQVRMMRALLNLNAYHLDAERVLRGEPPIRTIYPLPLPGK